MAKFGYTQSVGSIKSGIKEISTKPIPTIFTLDEFGLTSSNDKQHAVAIFRFLGLIDSECKPTNKWVALHDGEFRQEFASIIRSAYSELFEFYPDAPNVSDADLENFFKNVGEATGNTVLHMRRTFRGLCELADFDQLNSPFSNKQGGVNRRSIILNYLGGSKYQLEVRLDANIGAGQIQLISDAVQNLFQLVDEHTQN